MKKENNKNIILLHTALAKNNIEGLHPDILNNQIIIAPPIANGNIKDINNITINITNNKLVGNKIIVDFGFFCKDFEFDNAIKPLENAINKSIEFIIDIVNKKIYSYKYQTCLNGLFMGYRNSEELSNLKEIFLKEDLHTYCLMYKLKEKKEPTPSMLKEVEKELIENKNKACIYYCLWNDPIVKKINLYK